MTTTPEQARQDSSRTRLRWEIVLVLSITFGKSAVYSLLMLLRRYLTPTPISEQTTSLNPTSQAGAVWDVVYGLLDVFFDLALVGVVIYLMWEPGKSTLRKMGLDFTRIGSDVGRALLIGLSIGIPGLGLYLAGRALGMSVAIQASPEAVPWWTMIVLLFSAARAGIMEEVIMLGWLFDRLKKLGVGAMATIVISALIRGMYHAYQGIPGIIGNFVMGLVFGWAYHRWGRVMPLVVAHTLIDAVAFLGYPLALSLFPALLS